MIQRHGKKLLASVSVAKEARDREVAFGSLMAKVKSIEEYAPALGVTAKALLEKHGSIAPEDVNWLRNVAMLCTALKGCQSWKRPALNIEQTSAILSAAVLNTEALQRVHNFACRTPTQESEVKPLKMVLTLEGERCSAKAQTAAILARVLNCHFVALSAADLVNRNNVWGSAKTMGLFLKDLTQVPKDKGVLVYMNVTDVTDDEALTLVLARLNQANPHICLPYLGAQEFPLPKNLILVIGCEPGRGDAGAWNAVFTKEKVEHVTLQQADLADGNQARELSKFLIAQYYAKKAATNTNVVPLTLEDAAIDYLGGSLGELRHPPSQKYALLQRLLERALERLHEASSQ